MWEPTPCIVGTHQPYLQRYPERGVNTSLYSVVDPVCSVVPAVLQQQKPFHRKTRRGLLVYCTIGDKRPISPAPADRVASDTYRTHTRTPRTPLKHCCAQWRFCCFWSPSNRKQIYCRYTLACERSFSPMEQLVST